MIFIFCITVTTALLAYVFPRGFSHLGLSVQWCKWQCCVEIFLEVDMMDQSFPNHELVGQWSENDIVLNLLHNLFSKVSCQVISWRCLLFRRADILVITTGSTITILYWVLIKINYVHEPSFIILGPITKNLQFAKSVPPICWLLLHRYYFLIDVNFLRLIRAF